MFKYLVLIAITLPTWALAELTCVNSTGPGSEITDTTNVQYVKFEIDDSDDNGTSSVFNYNVDFNLNSEFVSSTSISGIPIIANSDALVQLNLNQLFPIGSYTYEAIFTRADDSNKTVNCSLTFTVVENFSCELHEIENTKSSIYQDFVTFRARLLSLANQNKNLAKKAGLRPPVYGTELVELDIATIDASNRYSANALLKSIPSEFLVCSDTGRCENSDYSAYYIKLQSQANAIYNMSVVRFTNELRFYMKRALNKIYSSSYSKATALAKKKRKLKNLTDLRNKILTDISNLRATTGDYAFDLSCQELS